MVRRYKTVLSVLLVILIATGIVLVTGALDINKIITEHEVRDNPALSQDYRDSFMTVADVNVPLLQSDIEDVLYSIDRNGDVKFYTLANDSITEIPETGNFEIKAEMSGQTLPAVIHYLEKDGKTTGCGLFTNELYENVYVYDYAFFKLSDFFPNYSHSDGTLLLMADVEKDRFYSEDKVYSEIFTLSSSHKLSYFLNENQRTIDLEAKMRTDYKMFTGDIDDQQYGKILFFSSRFYTANDSNTKIDIMSSGGSGENVDNLRYQEDVASLNLWRTDDGVYYFRNTEEGFKLCMFDGEEENDVRSFIGRLTEDYIIDGEYILNAGSGEIYRVTDGSIRTIDYSNMKKGFKPDLFEISDDGAFCIVRGSNNRNRPAVILCDFEAETALDYTDDVFGFIASMNVSSDGSVVLSIATDSTAQAFYQLVTTDGLTKAE